MSTRIERPSGGRQIAPEGRVAMRISARNLMLCTMAVLVLAACASTTAVNPVNPAASPVLVKIEPGIYAVPPDGPDLLLRLSEETDVRVLVVPTQFTGISDAHVAALRDWASRGGTVWIQGPGLENPSLRQLVPFQAKPFEFHKTDTGERGGELVVRDSVDRLQIHDHPLTEGVRQLYVYPSAHFDGTAGLVPLLEMTDNEGVHGTVIGVVPLGEGHVILDGTARTAGGFFSKMPGFDPNHPNAVKEGTDWNSYDWEKLVANARDLSNSALTERGTSGS